MIGQRRVQLGAQISPINYESERRWLRDPSFGEGRCAALCPHAAMNSSGLPVTNPAFAPSIDQRHEHLA